jgi:hypothetical protein
MINACKTCVEDKWNIRAACFAKHSFHRDSRFQLVLEYARLTAGHSHRGFLNDKADERPEHLLISTEEKNVGTKHTSILSIAYSLCSLKPWSQHLMPPDKAMQCTHDR